ncbi:MAG: deoxyribodipyrimidine photo-lyase [Candidatus Cloacimonadaceae bacterium]|jgi:deoxyribodipyrimidine photo-lyase|nr:deoxyribodipyrimidine photo-lyase [Candidatus Cloacimonadota bacterium]MDY0126769.1 deoxyribodipyrimidine photo-lyase [Candidatus Cloacimonadaceae bacterium]MCB5254028.1 deoxyribodipyrimidine photo-lyase [Candidatus Cloacimonadota bacterium]MCK9179057.1 deoxyribodipyrimidine photo-lyase [Candidatus Cloacimonadota bacterium]MCK9243234.1 deoxyribodipyrimidine photo-lyase [Candidatus Cloacimonadota bacterium]
MKDRILRYKASSKSSGSYVLYWMQQAQRIHCNPAFDYAVAKAQELKLGLIVCFVLSDEIPEANMRHYRFMLEALLEIAVGLAKRKIPFHVLLGKPTELIPRLGQKARLLVLDHGYLNWQRTWRDAIFSSELLSDTELVQLDTEATIPVHLASDKEEYTAATLRRKLVAKLPDWASYPDPPHYDIEPQYLDLQGIAHYPYDMLDIDALWAWACSELKLHPSPDIVGGITGGYEQAQKKLSLFIKEKLSAYAQYRNHPDLDYTSELSPYLHFGQISALEIIHKVFEAWQVPIDTLPQLIANKKQLTGNSLNLADYAEELIVRRELSMNFCFYNPDYDSAMCLPNWARKTLNNHLMDAREQHYSLDRLEQGETDDIYWNAAQRQMIFSGKMHGYMRMYWGKRLLSWCPSVDEAQEILLYLNNKYELDGRDVNAYAGIAWCFGKHDRPWAERPIFGMVRFMNAAGLKRKFDMDAYLRKVDLILRGKDEILA